eukprot:6578162-Prymnesium_polylepis.1
MLVVAWRWMTTGMRSMRVGRSSASWRASELERMEIPKELKSRTFREVSGRRAASILTTNCGIPKI